MQEARRAPLTGWAALGIGVAGVALDQVTKAVAVGALDPARPIRLLGGLLTLQLVRNSGAAFSLGSSSTWFFTTLATLATLFLLGYVLPRVRTRGWGIVTGLLLAGVVGNLIDRLFRAPGPGRGHVIDFLALPYWPIFNVADMCITFGAVGLFALTLWGRRTWDGKPARVAAAADDDVPAPATGKDD